MRFPRELQVIILLAATAALAFPQRGGAGGGARGGPVGAGPRQPNVIRSPQSNTGGRPFPIRSDYAPPTGLTPQAAGYTGIAPGGLKTIGPRSRYPFIPIFAPPIFFPGYPGGPGGFYNSPFSPTVAPYNEQNPDQANSSTMLANQDAMAQELRNLSAQMDDLKSGSPATPAASVAAPQYVAPAANSAAPPATEQLPIRLVLRSGQQLEVKSYAVMGGTVWDFSSSRAKKIPIASIDVAASEKATEANGGEFPALIKN